MLSKLEDVLKDKERELKLFHRFQELKNYCEENVFISSNYPLKKHVEDLKSLIETILPEPKDRTEEMFSGEVFTLLGIIYLHDIDQVKGYKWRADDVALNYLNQPDKKIFFNYGIGRELHIPEMAIEVINYLSFSNMIKKFPLEWEITEDNKKAVIRNTKVIGHIFNFAHLLLDVFFSEVKFAKLRRFNNSWIYMRKNDAVVDIDSREGIINIKYSVKFPYELHVIENVKRYIEDMFYIFKENVNGKLGMNYREIIWDIKNDFNYERDIFEIPRFSPYNEYEGPPFERWEKASLILDKLFDFGAAIVVGGISTGKTTVLKSFIMPQLLAANKNVFYCEIWERPVSEIRDVICKKYRAFSYTGLDIISLCKRLLEDEPCYFIIDNFERYAYIDTREREKFERFITFCQSQENIFIIVSGDKETFFEWFSPFSDIGLSSICEVKPIKGEKVETAYTDEKALWDSEKYYKPIEFEFLQANLNPERVLEDLLKNVKDEFEFRSIMSVFVDKNEKHIKRFTIDEIYAWTCIPRRWITGYLNLLKEIDVLIETESLNQTYYYLSSRYLIEPLYNILRLNDFDERKRIHNCLKNSIVNRTLLEQDDLDSIKKWKNYIIFTREETGVLLASLISKSEDYKEFFEKAKQDGMGIDIQPILQLLYVDDASKRAAAINLLIEIQDKDMINPLLNHLKNEDVPEIKDLLIKGIGMTKKKRAIVAIMNTLQEIGDKQMRLRAIDFFFNLFDGNARQLLIDIRENEKDPLILKKIDSMLSAIEET